MWPSFETPRKSAAPQDDGGYAAIQGWWARHQTRARPAALPTLRNQRKQQQRMSRHLIAAAEREMRAFGGVRDVGVDEQRPLRAADRLRQLERDRALKTV